MFIHSYNTLIQVYKQAGELVKQSAIARNRRKSSSRNEIEVKDARQKLLKVGRDMFLKEGSKNLSVRGVASKAGVNLGSFVYHFKTKDAFIAEIIYSHYDELINILNSAIDGLDVTQDPLTTLKRVVEAFSEASGNNPLAFRLIADLLQGEEIIMKAAMKNPPDHILFAVDVIKKCQAKGQIRKDMDARLVLIMIVSVMGFPALVGHQIEKKSSKSGLLKEMAALLIGDQARKSRLEVILKGLKP